VSSLTGLNAVQDVCRRGFLLPPGGGGLAFSMGTLPLPLGAVSQQQQVVLCSVGVGRSHVLDASGGGGGEGAPRAPPPAGYDSLYVHTGESGDEYAHRYVVFDAAQVLPRYVVHFSLQPGAAEAPKRRAGDINLEDIKARIADALSVLGPAASAATEKMLSDIGASYEEALAASRAPDALLEERRRSIGEALVAIDGKLKAIQANSAAVEDELYKAMQAAMFQLQDETQKKMNVLLSEELELRRQLGQLSWVDGFLAAAADSLPPMSFVETWTRAKALRAGLYPTLGGRVSQRVLEGVAPDLTLSGGLAVRCGSGGGGGGTPLLPPPGGADALPAAPPTAVSDFWAEMLRASMGLAPLPADVSLSAGGIPVFTVEQARAELARARADLTAVETTAAGLPAEFAPQGAAAREQAHARVAQVRALVELHAARAGGGGGGGGGARAAAAVPPPPPPPPPPPSASQRLAAGGGGGSAFSAALPPALAAFPALPALPAVLSQRLARFSLHKEAERKRRARGPALEAVDVAAAGVAFAESALLSRAQAADLFFALPWGGGSGGAEDFGDGSGGAPAPSSPPATTLLAAGEGGAAISVRALLEQYATLGAREPTVLLLRAGGYVFGGYAAEPLEATDFFYGSPRCFLFSVSRDAKFPYHGRARGPRQANDEALAAAHELSNLQAATTFAELLAQARELSGGAEPSFDEAGRLLVTEVDAATGATFVTTVPVPRPKPFVRCDALRVGGGEDVLQFGVGDLVLRGNLARCSSDLEKSYGVGLRPEEAAGLLAGAAEFKVDSAELWAVSAAR
jgi:hypothetical protein